MNEFFQRQVKTEIFQELPVRQPYYIGKGNSGMIEWYADKWYKCNVCGTLWEFKYPDFPACGQIRKFADGIYPEPETNF